MTLCPGCGVTKHHSQELQAGSPALLFTCPSKHHLTSLVCSFLIKQPEEGGGEMGQGAVISQVTYRRTFCNCSYIRVKNVTYFYDKNKCVKYSGDFVRGLPTIS